MTYREHRLGWPVDRHRIGGQALGTKVTLVLGKIVVIAQHDAAGWKTITAGAINLLVVFWEGFGRSKMHDLSNIRLVNAHTKCDRGHHIYNRVAQKTQVHTPADIPAW